MMGANFIGYTRSAEGSVTFRAVDPSTGVFLPGHFTEATIAEADRAVELAVNCFPKLSSMPLSIRAQFLASIADELEALGDLLLDRYCSESGLDRQRAITERTRTVGQLRAFSKELITGDWLEASIDRSGDGVTSPQVDLRRMMKGLGPVVVFGAGNFPLAYSTAGGDTASALAAGCPVIVKAHPSHPGTNELVAGAIIKAAEQCNMPEGVFSSLNSNGFEVGQYLVQHPGVKAVGFTGSYVGGKALFDLAANRMEPIPVFAEMGSLNPVIVLRDAVQANAEKITELLAQSVTYGAGQFCTKPGLIFVEEDRARAFEKLLGEKIAGRRVHVMLSPQIHARYETLRTKALESGEEELYSADEEGLNTGANTLLAVSAEHFLVHPQLTEEVFGPFSVIVHCKSTDELLSCLNVLKGQLTCSLFAENREHELIRQLVDVFEEKAGRVIYNGVPTGVAVCPSMTHGGPFPATTDPRFSAVGLDAMRRFLRPVTYQNFPEELLPPVLQRENLLGIRRRVNGQYTVENLSF